MFNSRLEKLLDNTKNGIMYGEWNDNGRLLDERLTLNFVEEIILAKKNGICILILILIMLLFPWGAVTFIKGDGGMAACFLLFFLVNPITAVVVGIFSGRNMKSSWFQSLLLSALFLLGTWVFFDMRELAFILYAVVYLVLGFLAMLITSFLARKRDR